MTETRPAVHGPSCPVCRRTDSSVTDSRPREENGVGAVFRRRHCSSCAHRFGTVERTVGLDSAVAAYRKKIRRALNQFVQDISTAITRLREVLKDD
jgi:transcriptional regulator NrdR family protein